MNDLQTMVETLEGLMDKLGENDREFADNLIKGKWGFYARGFLTEKQARWIPVLIERAENADKPGPTCDVDLSKVKSFLLSAKPKAPKVWLRTADGRELKVYIAGPRSKVPGAVNFVLYTMEDWGGRTDTWLGRVLDNGDWHRPYSTSDSDIEAIQPLLEQLGNAPAEAAQAYGKLTGRCCFCNHGLSDQDKSTKVGYGPTCAKRYGLHNEWKAAAKS